MCHRLSAGSGFSVFVLVVDSFVGCADSFGGAEFVVDNSSNHLSLHDKHNESPPGGCVSAEIRV